MNASSSKPLAIDLYCGLGGWTDALLAEGYRVIGYDIERHEYGPHRYQGELVLQDVTTIDGATLKGAQLIVASPPCQRYSYMAMPWTRARELSRWYEDAAHPERRLELNSLFDACFKIQREASSAAGRSIPLVVENVRGAQRWVGPARWWYGSFYLWGDVPALMPIARGRAARKVLSQNWSRYKETGEVSPHWRLSGIKNSGGSWFSRSHGRLNETVTHPDGWERRRNDPRDAVNQFDGELGDGIKNGGDWFDGQGVWARSSHGSSRRKMASALIAKIPYELARHIARTYR